MVIRIESPDNGRLKLVRKLRSKKGRSAEGKFVAEGINLVREILDRGIAADFILVSEGYDYSTIEKAAGSIPVGIVPSLLFDRLTDADSGAGVLAVLDMPERSGGTLSGHAEAAAVLPESGNILVLDRLQDPGNIGTMIRTAVAAGYSMIIAVKGTADIYSPKVLRATAGMIFEMPVVYMQSTEEAVQLIKASGRRLAVTVPSGGAPYYKEDLRSGLALVIGNEGNGISDEMLRYADLRITLPMKGGIESLNAAVSAAILMYEAVRE